MPLASDLVEPNADVIGDSTGSDGLPEGWRNLVSGLLAGIAAILRRPAGARIRITRAAQEAGGLVVLWEPDGTRPPDGGTAGQIELLLRQAEERALRTCDRCGERGDLRLLSDGEVATRCDAHVHVVEKRTRRVAGQPSRQVVDNVLRCHGDWLTSGGRAFVDLPRGWVGLLAEGLHGLRGLPTARGLRLLGLCAVLGRLEIRVEHGPEDFTVDDFLEWRARLRALGDAASFTCDVCGADGYVRWPDEGVGAPRCDAHADFGRWRSYHWTAPTRADDALLEVTSTRPQLRFDAFLAAAPPRASARGTPPGSTDSHALYDPADVAAALGLAHDGEDGFDDRPPPSDNEQQARLRRLLDRGEEGRWRRLVRPTPGMVESLDALACRAPHLDALSSTLRRHVMAALTLGLPVVLPPILVLGEPGVGKTWFLSRLAEAIAVPFRSQPMSGVSHSDGFGGAHPVWRNSSVGLVAKTLLHETAANPVIFVDEFDKVALAASGDDLYRPFYVLLEPTSAKRFVDAFLQFPIDASCVSWVLAANATEGIPRPILDRVTIIEVPAPSEAQLAAVVRSVYAEANAKRRGFFPAELPAAIGRRLAGMTPRFMRVAIEHAMTQAASQGRRDLQPGDLPDREPQRRAKFGFH